MKDVYIISKVVARKGEAIASPSKGAQKIDFSDYLLKSMWDKVFELKTDSQGIDYIFSKLPVVTQYGITMYSGEGVNIPSLASGLPFDGRTIWYNTDTNQIEVIGGTGGGSGEGVSNFWDLSGIPSWITISKPKYTYSEIEGTPDLSVYATQNWIISQGYASAEELKKYIPISGYTEVSGEKNFTGGLKVNGSPIYYDTEKKYWKLEGDLLVTGGVTMYGVDSTDIPSLINSLPVATTKEKGVAYFDPNFFSVSSDGKVSFIGETGGGLDIVSLQNYLTQNSYLNVTEGDNRYLKLSGGTIKTSGIGLNIDRTSGNSPKIGYYINNSLLGCLGFSASGKPVAQIGSGAEYEILYSGNYSSYALPLSGGTLSNSYEPLIIKRLSDEGASFIRYSNNEGLIGTIGVGGSASSFPYDVFFQRKSGSAYKIWHSGNGGSGSGLDADLLDGKHADAFALSNRDIKLDSFVNQIGYGFKSQGWYESGAAMMFGANSSCYMLLQGAAHESKIYLRANYMNNGSYVGWKDIAFTDSNVASATKLQTPRTIWGQSFDGTGDIEGGLVIKNDSAIYIKDASGTNRRMLQLNAFNTNLIANSTHDTVLYGKSCYLAYGTSASYGIILNSSGNVGIGTTSPSHKLYVVGDIFASSKVNVNGIEISKSKDDVLYIDGNVVVRGGVTMYGVDSTSVPSILNSLPIASTTKKGIAYFDSAFFSVGSDGKVSFIGKTDGFNATELQNYLTQNSYLNTTSGDNRYLKLSGGTLSNSYEPLIIKRLSDEGASFIRYSNNEGLIGTIGVGGSASSFPYDVFFQRKSGSAYKIWHSGNGGSGSGLDADLLDGKQPSELNVGSATKLQTARTIWGQSFDGTGNVNGVIYMPNNTALCQKDANGDDLRAIFTSAAGSLAIGNDHAEKGYITYLSGNEVILRYGKTRVEGLYLSYLGNVGIGTTNPYYRLHVVGNTYLNGDVFADELNTYDVIPRASATYDLGNSSYKWNNVYASSMIAGYIHGGGNALYLGNSENTSYIYIREDMASSSDSWSIKLGGEATFGSLTSNGALTVTGDTTLNSTLTGNYWYLNNSASNPYLRLNRASSSSSYWYIQSVSGYISIGGAKSANSVRIDASGNILAAGGITMYSQRSLKNIQDERGLSLHELGAIKPIRYTWKDNRDNRLHIGGIADDIQQVLPEVVYKTNDGVLTMDYGNAAFAIASSLIKPVIDHEKRIAMLEEENKQLRQEVERLKSA